MFRVFTLTLTHFLAKTIFTRGYGGVQNTRGNSRGVGGLFLWSKNGNSEVEGGSYVKFPPWWGYGYFLEPHNASFTSVFK